MRSRPSGRGRYLPWLASLVVSAALLTYLLSQIDPGELVEAARGLNRRHLATFMAVGLVGVLARAIRFSLLLGGKVRLRDLVAVTFARNLFIDLLPVRLGELSYVYLLTRRIGRTLEDAVSSLLLATLFDVAAIAPLLVLALVVVGGTADLPVGLLVALAGLLAVGSAVAIRLAEPVAGRVATLMAAGTPTDRRRRLATWLEHLTGALREVRTRGMFAPVFAVSLVVRLTKFGSYYFLFLAVMSSRGFTAESAGFFRIFLGVVSAELAAMLPVHGVAGFGTFETAWALGFTQLGFSMDDAVISGFLAHVISQLVEYSMGGIALVWLMRPEGGSAVRG